MSSSDALGAHAYASGSNVAFAGAPDLFTAAHEAAHVVQQSSGVQLLGGVGKEGDVHERHADAVAGEVVAGRSAAPLLSGFAPFNGQSASTQVQHKKKDTIDSPGMTIEAGGAGSMPHEEYRAAADAGERDEKESL